MTNNTSEREKEIEQDYFTSVVLDECAKRYDSKLQAQPFVIGAHWAFGYLNPAPSGKVLSDEVQLHTATRLLSWVRDGLEHITNEDDLEQARYLIKAIDVFLEQKPVRGGGEL